MTGTLIAMKGANAENELTDAANAIQKLHLRLRSTQKDELPSGDKRITYFFAKDDHTAKKYPRRWDEIQRNKL